MSEKGFSKSRKRLWGFLGWAIGTFLGNVLCAFWNPFPTLPGAVWVFACWIGGGIYGARTASEMYMNSLTEVDASESIQNDWLAGNQLGAYQCPKCQKIAYLDTRGEIPNCNTCKKRFVEKS